MSLRTVLNDQLAIDRLYFGQLRFTGSEKHYSRDDHFADGEDTVCHLRTNIYIYIYKTTTISLEIYLKKNYRATDEEAAIPEQQFTVQLMIN